MNFKWLSKKLGFNEKDPVVLLNSDVNKMPLLSVFPMVNLAGTFPNKLPKIERLRSEVNEVSKIYFTLVLKFFFISANKILGFFIILSKIFSKSFII